MGARRWTAVAMLALAGCAAEPQAPGPVGETEQAVSVCPAGTLPEGVNISGGQGVVDWVKLKASGREFAFIKATQGDYYTSNHWTDQWTGAKSVGMLRSAYHFFDPTIDGVLQAKHFLAVVGPLGPGDLPPMLDIECPTSSVQASAQSNCEHTGDSGWVPAATLNQRIHDWLVYVEQQTGMKPIVYSYNYWFSGAGADTAPLHAYPLYISSPCVMPTGAPLCTIKCYQIGLSNDFTSAQFWQWNVNASQIPGVAGAVDLDRFVGTSADLRKMAGLDADGGLPDAGRDAGRDGGDGGGDAGDGGRGSGDGGSGMGAGGACGCRTGGAPGAGGGAGGGWALAALGLVGLGAGARLRRRRAA